ncbi:MAG: 2-phosphosulfolactate phosphatase [Bacteroidales bacterium]|nr:2-phosphosulfolactate phosphatase [Bacteroidales bacterium]
MKITTLPFAGSVLPKDINDKTVVVIDVLRATSTMITALMHGAKQIFPVREINQAFDLKKRLSGTGVLLCGERDAGIIPGFDLGNSPLEFTAERIRGKTLIFSTTNGTKAIESVRNARKVLLGSFLNAAAIAEKLQHEKEIVLLCSGTNGQFSMDDAFCAAYITTQIKKQVLVQGCDLTNTLLLAFQNTYICWRDIIKKCHHSKLLISKGYEKDVDYCLQTSLTDQIPCYNSQLESISSI